MDTEFFYADLPVLDNFLDISDSRNFRSVPTDWYILITDIVGSTQAIEAGQYKEVNLIGACSIVAVLNIAEKLEIPFVFGGDGAAMLIPPSLFAKARQALLATRQLAITEFGMELRVGVVPVLDVKVDRYDVKVAKVWISENYYQAAFTGGGLSYATQLIKNPVTAQLYNHSITIGDEKADFSSLECRWQDIPSKHGETISLIVRVLPSPIDSTNNFYQEIIEKIQSIYGSEDLNPIVKDHLKLAFSYKYLKSETRLRAKSRNFWHKILYFFQIWIENILGWLLMTFKITLAGVEWGTYKENTLATTDYKKFDDMLRMVIDGNEAQRKKLERFLENNYKKGKLVYGLHVSNRALMTCLVFERNGRQVHFIDGADGGYSAAAKVMKHRIKEIKKKGVLGTTSLDWQPASSLLT